MEGKRERGVEQAAQLTGSEHEEVERRNVELKGI